ncbi:MAG: hypothetical protein J6U54_08230 [Clostridiales bacterium]|nr:hypothetical protein [Clostridiales bacterium]
MRVIFKFIFWLLFALINTKFVMSALRWLQLDPDDREPFWTHIKNDLIGRII